MEPGNLNLTQIQTFLWVASLRSFRKTAEKMDTTQPAISSRISRLEETLGVRLFERDTSFIRLTSKGTELLPYAEKLLRTSANLVDHIGQSTGISGVLRLGISEIIVHTWLPDFIKGLNTKFPKIGIEIVVDTTQNLSQELTERSLDLAFIMGPVSDLHIENHALMEFEIIWAAASSLEIDTNHPLSIDELASNVLITYGKNTRPYTELARQLRRRTEVTASVFNSSSLAAIHRMALDGIGIASIPRQMISEELADGRLKEILCEWRPPNLKFTASYPAEPYNPVMEEIIHYAVDITRSYQEQVL